MFHLRALLYFLFVAGQFGIGLRRRLLVVIAGGLTGACGRRAGSFPMPAQQSLDLGPDPGGLRSMVRMERVPDADTFLVRDISPEQGVFPLGIPVPGIAIARE